MNTQNQMKTIFKLTFLTLTIWFVVSIFLIHGRNKQIDKLVIENSNLFTVTEAMQVFKRGHEKGSLRAFGNEFNYSKMYDTNGFKADSTLFDRQLKRAMK